MNAKKTAPETRDPGSQGGLAGGTVKHGGIDLAMIAFGRLFAFGWSHVEGPILEIAIKPPHAPARAVKVQSTRFARDDVQMSLRAAGVGALAEPGFVAIAPLDERLIEQLLAAFRMGAPAILNLRTGSPVVVAFETPVVPLASAVEKRVLTKKHLAFARRAAGAPGDPGTDLALALIEALFADNGLQHHIDSVETMGGDMALLRGWAEGAGAARIFIARASLAEAPLRLDAVPVARADVSGHLRSQGASPANDDHGFAAAVPLESVREPFRLCVIAGEEARIGIERKPPIHAAGRAVLFDAIMNCAASSRLQGADAVERLARPFLGTPEPPQVARILRAAVREGGATPRVSVIVPFYRECFYLLDHLFSQGRARPDIEWIFVCDDPRIAAEMTAVFERSQALVRQPSKLVLLDRNGGYGQANNAGASEARGEYLLLMNSDIYCRGFDFLGRALKAMDADQSVGAVGFSLLFEDGSVQHDGMKFVKGGGVPLYADFWLALHPGKGLPPRADAPPVEEVEAVTAALMLVRRGHLDGEPLFDPEYVVGDFEDSDLCLRLKQRGSRILLMRTNEIYHLERQSLETAPNPLGTTPTTLLNCIRFNRRWGDTIRAMTEGAR